MVRPDVVSAGVTARASGRRVEVLSERSVTSRTWVNPDGTLSSEMAGGPVRFEDATATGTDGWRDIDVTLKRNPDGTVSPAATPARVVLAGAGDNASKLITTTDGKDKVTLGAGIDGTLPAPVLDGDTAVYPDVLAGVDVKVQVRPTGFETFWIVKDRAGLNALLEKQTGGDLGLSTDLSTSTSVSVTPKADGTVSLSGKTKTDDGAVAVSKFATPSVWDAAATDGTTAAPSELAPAELTVTDTDGSQVPVKGSVSGDLGLSVVPDQAWLDSPDRVFPITIDPTYVAASAAPIYDGFVEETWTGDHSSDDKLKFGNNGETPDLVARTYMVFSTTAIQGKTITSGSLDLYGTYTRTCAARAWSSWNAGVATTATRWTNQPWVSDQYGTSTQAKGYQTGCPNGTVKIDMTKQLKMWSGSTTNPRGILLRADNETDTSYWKEFASSETTHPPVLRWTYSRAPGKAATPTISPTTSYTPAGATSPSSYTSSTMPRARAVMAADPDGDPSRGRFFAFADATTTDESLAISTCVGGVYHPAGDSSSCLLKTALANNTTVWVRARSQDSTGLIGPMSAARQVRVASTVPAKPAITCPGLTNNTWTTSGPTTATTCTLTATGTGYSAPSAIKWSLDGKTAVVTAITQSSSAATATMTVSIPGVQGGHKIVASAVSPSGLTSAQALFQTGWGTASLDTPKTSPQVTTTDTVTVAASGPPKGGSAMPTAKVQWRVAGATGSAGWTDAPAGTTFTVTDQAGGTSATAIFDTTTLVGQADASAVTVGERTATLLDLRVCLSYDTGTQCTGSARIQRVPHAYGSGFPEADAGPGTVGLWTGELSVSDTDAELATPDGGLSVSRSHNSFAGPSTGVQNRVFGPGWTASFDGDGSGAGGAEVWDNSHIDGSISIVDADGSILTYLRPGTPPGARRTTAPIPTGTWIPADDDTAEAGESMVVSGTGTSTILELKGDDGIITTFQVTAAPTAGTATLFKTVEVREPATASKTTYSYDTAGRVTAITAGLPDGVTVCVPGTPAAGCRVLKISYAAATTATASTPGDFAGQVSKITAQVNTDTDRVLATYTYNVSGQLVTQTDPRSNLSTSYGWTGTGTGLRLATYTPPGQAAYTFTYANNRLFKVTRPNPASAGGGTAQLGAYVYDVPLSGTVASLPDMTSVVDAWNQDRTPTWGVAVFGQDKTITAAPAAGSPDWQYADLQFTDPDGYTVNTANFGAGDWQLTATDYDDQGNVIRAWDQRAIAGIRSRDLPGGQAAADSATVTVYNADITNTAGDVITPAGTLVTDVYKPVHDVVAADGTTQPLRLHSATSYDQGAPNSGVDPNTGQPYRLPTKTVDTAESSDGTVDGNPLSITLTGYAAVVSGDKTGWELGQATSTTTDMDLSGTVTTGDITTTTRYDAKGRVIENRQPKSSGSDAGTRVTAYYTGASTGTTGCVSKPEWAGQVCQTGPAAQPAGQTMPVTTTTGYTWDLQTSTVVQTSGTVTSTTTTSFNAQDRPTTVTTTVTGLTGSTPVPAVTTSYDPATGLTTGTSSTAGTTAMTYDTRGRQLTYTNTPAGATADTSTTTYDPAGNVASVVDNNGQTSYVTDGTDANGRAERRGLTTAVKVKVTGGTEYTSTGAYDSAGSLSVEKLPGNLIRRTDTDVAGDQTGLTINGDAVNPDTGLVEADQPWLGWTTTVNAQDKITNEYTPDSIADGDADQADHTYTYDRAGRLTTVQDRTGTPDTNNVVGCVTRTYAFDINGNRTSQTSRPAAANGDCTTTGGTSISRAYDTADRPTTGGNGTGSYTYDQLGRQTSIPAADTPQPGQGAISLGYYDTDNIRTITQGTPGSGGTSTTYTLDGNQRRLKETATNTTGTTTTIRHYTDNGDNPTWSTATTGTTTTTSRYNELINGDLGLTINTTGGVTTATLALATPRGDTAATVTLGPTATPAAGIDNWTSYTEYGTPATATPTTPAGINYGWLGAKQRAGSLSGLVLMGARLYNPTSGAFSSIDPVPGGGSTAYEYPTDPINNLDLDGNRWWGRAKRWASRNAARVGCTLIALCRASMHGTISVAANGPFTAAQVSFSTRGGHPTVWGSVGYGHSRSRGWSKSGVSAMWNAGSPNPRSKASVSFNVCRTYCGGVSTGYTGRGTIKGFSPGIGVGYGQTGYGGVGHVIWRSHRKYW